VRRIALTVVQGLLELGRRDIAERLEQPVSVVPRDPGERRELDVIDASPGMTSGKNASFQIGDVIRESGAPPGEGIPIR
jgi:hypothetical protein